MISTNSTKIKNSELLNNVESTYLKVDLPNIRIGDTLKLGIEINIDVIPGSALKQAKANGKLDFFRASWIADYPDAENYLSLFYSKNLAPDGPNYTHFSNEEYDRMYENSLKETNPEKSKLLYQKMDSIITSKSIIVPLFYDEVVRFISKNVVGMEINATNLLDLRNVRKVD